MKIARFAVKAVLGILFWAMLVLIFLAGSNKVFAAEPNRYREVIMNMTPEEVTEIQQILYWEAGTDTWEGRVATAQVMLNRVLSEDPYLPDTVHGVLSQKGQYSTWHLRNRAKYGERESDAIEFLCNCREDELYTDRVVAEDVCFVAVEDFMEPIKVSAKTR